MRLGSPVPAAFQLPSPNAVGAACAKLTAGADSGSPRPRLRYGRAGLRGRGRPFWALKFPIRFPELAWRAVALAISITYSLIPAVYLSAGTAFSPPQHPQAPDLVGVPQRCPANAPVISWAHSSAIDQTPELTCRQRAVIRQQSEHLALYSADASPVRTQLWKSPL